MAAEWLVYARFFLAALLSLTIISRDRYKMLEEPIKHQGEATPTTTHDDSDSDGTVVNHLKLQLPSTAPKPISKARTTLFHRLLQLPQLLFTRLLLNLYLLYQKLIIYLFAPAYHKPEKDFKPLGRIAIVGAGLTGISSAATLVDHGFEVVVYEAGETVGGIWARVNSTSSLQLNSILYRFHPSIMWSCGFPHRDEIVEQIELLWKRYHLESSTRLNTKVTQIHIHPEFSTSPSQGGHNRWVINNGSDGIFDAVILSVGTCGSPKFSSIAGVERLQGRVLHSSDLDGLGEEEVRGKRVVIVGSGASGVESAELAVGKGAQEVVVLARDDKWIIPRNTFFDVLLALQPFGREMPLSFIPEHLIRFFHYRSLHSLPPVSKGLFEGTPIVNDTFLQHIREEKVIYKRGETLEVLRKGVKFNAREDGEKKGEEGKEEVIEADIIVMATGYEKPSIDMLPHHLFPVEGERNYQRPNLYLQNFCTEDWSILLTNASYKDAIGTVGNWHISLYARTLALFLLDPSCRPTPTGMKLWVDLINWIKTATFIGGKDKTSGLAFFTYLELCVWMVSFSFFRISRLPWLPFMLFGWGVRPRTKEEGEYWARNKRD